MAPKAFGQEGRECGTTTALCRKTVAKQQEAKVNTLLPETQPQFEGIFVNSKAQTLEKPFPFFFFSCSRSRYFPLNSPPTFCLHYSSLLLGNPRLHFASEGAVCAFGYWIETGTLTWCLITALCQALKTQRQTEKS